MIPNVESFYDTATGILSHIAYAGTPCAVIDPVPDYDAGTGRTISAPSLLAE
ncbi:hypothetical protein [Paraburkholderia sp. BR10954]|uniref:hypothetical protein n=1 Tax=unclassified Paraburkholderia TaxID=2615204 RepID=UPI0034D26099